MSIFSTCNDVMNINGILESTIDMCNSIESLEEGVFKYTPSMIPVAARETSEGTKYIVEFDMLRKLANNNNTTIVDSFESICSENSIDENDTYVYVSESTINSIADSALSESCTGNLISINYEINSLMESGINILTTSIDESTKYNPLKLDKIAKENPKIKEIKSDLEFLSTMNGADNEVLYKNKNTIVKSISKITRVICSFIGNAGELFLTPLSVLIGGFNIVGAGIGKKIMDNFDFGFKDELDKGYKAVTKQSLLGFILSLICTILGKLSVRITDKSEAKELRGDMNNIISQLEEMRSKSNNDTEKGIIDTKIEGIKRLMDKLDEI